MGRTRDPGRLRWFAARAARGCAVALLLALPLLQAVMARPDWHQAVHAGVSEHGCSHGRAPCAPDAPSNDVPWSAHACDFSIALGSLWIDVPFAVPAERTVLVETLATVPASAPVAFYGYQRQARAPPERA